MSEVPSFNPENIDQKEIFFEGLESKVTVPEKSLVPPQEGFHLRVEPKIEQPPYFMKEAKINESLKTFMLAIATARSVFGSPQDRENYYQWNQWVNVHLLPRFGGQGHMQIEVIGRNARGNTWAKPVEYPQSEEFDPSSVVIDEAKTAQRTLPDYTAEVSSQAKDIILFDQPESEDEPGSTAIYHFQNYQVLMPKENPHVEESGLHVWIAGKYPKEIEGVQADLKSGVEQFILASAVAKSIYETTGRMIEIHFSSNWGLPTKGHWSENLGVHANMYAAPPGKESVGLPPRPGYERPPVSEETRQQIEQALEQNMPQYLDEFINENLQEVMNEQN